MYSQEDSEKSCVRFRGENEPEQAACSALAGSSRSQTSTTGFPQLWWITYRGAGAAVDGLGVQCLNATSGHELATALTGCKATASRPPFPEPPWSCAIPDGHATGAALLHPRPQAAGSLGGAGHKAHATVVHGCAMGHATEARPPQRPGHHKLTHEWSENVCQSAQRSVDQSVWRLSSCRHRTAPAHCGAARLRSSPRGLGNASHGRCALPPPSAPQAAPRSQNPSPARREESVAARRAPPGRKHGLGQGPAGVGGAPAGRDVTPSGDTAPAWARPALRHLQRA